MRRVKSDKAANITSRFFTGWNVLNNYQKAQNGQIWLMWDPKQYQVDLILLTAQLIHVQVKHLSRNWHCLLSAIYASNEGAERTELWDVLRTAAPSPDKECLLMGDYNEVISPDEKIIHGEISTIRSGLKDCCINLELLDVKSIGLFYTWCNNQEGKHRIYCKPSLVW